MLAALGGGVDEAPSAAAGRDGLGGVDQPEAPRLPAVDGLGGRGPAEAEPVPGPSGAAALLVAALLTAPL